MISFLDTLYTWNYPDTLYTWNYPSWRSLSAHRGILHQHPTSKHLPPRSRFGNWQVRSVTWIKLCKVGFDAKRVCGSRTLKRSVSLKVGCLQSENEARSGHLVGIWIFSLNSTFKYALVAVFWERDYFNDVNIMTVKYFFSLFCAVRHNFYEIIRVWHLKKLQNGWLLQTW